MVFVLFCSCSSVVREKWEENNILIVNFHDTHLKGRLNKANVKENSLRTLKPDRNRSKGRERALLPVISVASSMRNDSSDQQQIQMVYSARY